MLIFVTLLTYYKNDFSLALLNEYKNAQIAAKYLYYPKRYKLKKNSLKKVTLQPVGIEFEHKKTPTHLFIIHSL